LTKKDFTSNRLPCRIEADSQAGRFTIFKSDTVIIQGIPSAGSLASFTGISFRTGPPRPIIDRARTSVTNDSPTAMCTYTIQHLKIQ
jgi:hypothetical protein